MRKLHFVSFDVDIFQPGMQPHPKFTLADIALESSEVSIVRIEDLNSLNYVNDEQEQRAACVKIKRSIN
jgi:hypothetical protein